MDLSPGLMVSANVRLTRPLGEGAMGCVWVADHLTLRTQVAVKFIAPELAADNQELLTRFVQEASLAAQIRSPHVVQIFDQGVMSDGTPFMVMELLEGESLQEWLDRRGRLSTRECSAVLIHVSRALRRAHELGIVHRDIKPDNIFVSQSEDGLFAKVLDFGIAKQTQLPKMGLTNAGVMVGTPEYMSPEQVLSAKDVDYRADLWALAITAYQALTGQLPFQAEALGTLCVKLLDGKFPPPSELRRDLPPGLDAWFLRALAHEVDHRFDSAREMALSFVRLVAAAEGIPEEEVTFSGVMPNVARPELGPRNKLAPSAKIDVTAPLSAESIGAPLAPAGPPETAPLPNLGPARELEPAASTSPLPEPAGVARSETLAGSSASRRADGKRPVWAFVGGGAAIGGLVAAIVVLSDPSAPVAGAPEVAGAESAEASPDGEGDEAAAGAQAEPEESSRPEQAEAEGEEKESEAEESAESADEPAEEASGDPAPHEPDAVEAFPPPPERPAPRPQPTAGAPPPAPTGKKRYDHGF